MLQTAAGNYLGNSRLLHRSDVIAEVIVKMVYDQAYRHMNGQLVFMYGSCVDECPALEIKAGHVCRLRFMPVMNPRAKTGIINIVIRQPAHDTLNECRSIIIINLVSAAFTQIHHYSFCPVEIPDQFIKTC